MELTNLNKSLTEIFKHRYIIPLYQRNFAWGKEEIESLIQDIYEAFQANNDNNYFIGSLIVLKRKDGNYEVIDGQQRLTAITLLSRILEVDFLKEPKLRYESRHEVEAFFDSFYRTGQTTDAVSHHKVSHLTEAVNLIRNTVVNPAQKELKTLFEIDNLESFKKFFSNNVILIKVEVPEDTDVANYFEIMNNRGEQLQKHEILKAKLMEKIKDENHQYHYQNQEAFSKIWDACAQIDIPIQKLYNVEERTALFGENYDSFNGIEKFKILIAAKSSGKENIRESIHKILNDFSKNDNPALSVEDVKNDSDDKNDSDNKSIIDFPNFLMHVFKALYDKKDQIEEPATEISLNEKELLKVYNLIHSRIDPLLFIEKLLFYRTIFDRFIVRSSLDEHAEDNYRWSLLKPDKYYNENGDNHSLRYKATFGNQEGIVKALSLLQVTFRTRKYKTWLQDLLIVFEDVSSIEMSKETYQKILDKWMLKYYNTTFPGSDTELFNKGTRTPHFIFNFIDYLYWIKDSKNKGRPGLKFDFKYRNSVEHHLPQSFKNESNNLYLDKIGNLCLVSASSNSKMNNEDPKGKASKDGKYYRDTLPPKQKEMYEMTNKANKWSIAEIEAHERDVISLIESRNEILTS